jgi:general stress protein 26
MSDLSLSDIAEKMRDIDVCMLSTHSGNGDIAGRPMSNNRDVDYDGDSHYFTWDDARMVEDIEHDDRVALSFEGEDGFMVAVQGRAEIVRDKERFAEHWSDDLDDWFEDGPDTEGVVMIKVRATRVHYWDGEESAEVKL